MGGWTYEATSCGAGYGGDGGPPPSPADCRCGLLHGGAPLPPRFILTLLALLVPIPSPSPQPPPPHCQRPRPRPRSRAAPTVAVAVAIPPTQRPDGRTPAPCAPRPPKRPDLPLRNNDSQPLRVERSSLSAAGEAAPHGTQTHTRTGSRVGMRPRLPNPKPMQSPARPSPVFCCCCRHPFQPSFPSLASLIRSLDALRKSLPKLGKLRELSFKFRGKRGRSGGKKYDNEKSV